MKKILIIFFGIILSFNCASAIEEITLDTAGDEKKSYFDYLADVYYGRIEEKDDISPLLRIFSRDGLEFKNSPINSVKLTFLYGSELNYTDNERSSDSLKYRFGVIEPMVKVNFNDYKSDLMFDINIVKDINGHSNPFTEKINQLYAGHKINDNQKVIFGQSERLPNTYNGSLTTMEQEYVLKSQLGRTFGDTRSVGVRNL